MIAEILVSVRDNEAVGVLQWKAWQPVAYNSLGFSISPADVYEWIYSETIPAAASGFKKNRMTLMQKHINLMRSMYVNRLSYEQIAAELYPGITIGEEEIKAAQEHYIVYESVMSNLVTYGIDSNWGYKDLQENAVVIVEATKDDLDDLVMEPEDETINIVSGRTESWARRRYMIDTSGIFSAEDLGSILDKDIYVPVKRSLIPINLSEIAVDMEASWR